MECMIKITNKIANKLTRYLHMEYFTYYVEIYI